MKEIHDLFGLDDFEPQLEGVEFKRIKEDGHLSIKTSLEDPPALELKQIPDHLEYAFLQCESSLLVFVSSQLTSGDKERLLRILKSHKRAIAWKTDDIPEMNSVF